MRIVDLQPGVVSFGQPAQGIQIGDIPVHAEDTVGDDDTPTRTPGSRQQFGEMPGIIVAIAGHAGRAQASAVE